MYKITFNMKTAICFIDRPIFDGIISYCYAREYLGNKFKQALNYDDSDFIDYENMPLKKHQDGYFISTWMMFDKEIEYQTSWKKRWANEHDDLTDFGKNKRKIRINSGKYKSYDIPMNMHHVRSVWFYFDSDDIKALKYLIDKWLFGIGKKTSQGYGEIISYVIEKSDFDFTAKVYRPIPIDQNKLNLLLESNPDGLQFKYTGYRPPYWLPQNQTFCLIN